VASGLGRRGGGEDPWLCDPGFGRVCPYRGMCESADSVRSGTEVVKRAFEGLLTARPYSVGMTEDEFLRALPLADRLRIAAVARGDRRAAGVGRGGVGGGSGARCWRRPLARRAHSNSGGVAFP
jgi:hypothetical protein